MEPEDQGQPCRKPLEGQRQRDAAEGFQQGDGRDGPCQQQRETSQALPSRPDPLSMIRNREARHVPRSLALPLPVLLSMIMALPGSIGFAHAQGGAAASIEGRWRGEILPPLRGLGLEAIEIARCGSAFCGRAVSNQACGPVILRLSPVPRGLEGELNLWDRTFRVQALREGDRMTLWVSPLQASGPAPLLLSRRIMPVAGSFVHDGPASCPPSVSLRRESHPFGSMSFTRPLALAKSMRPAYLPRSTLTTLPMSFMEAAPVSAMAA